MSVPANVVLATWREKKRGDREKERERKEKKKREEREREAR